jgi:hypothetical protein
MILKSGGAANGYWGRPDAFLVVKLCNLRRLSALSRAAPLGYGLGSKKGFEHAAIGAGFWGFAGGFD